MSSELDALAAELEVIRPGEDGLGGRLLDVLEGIGIPRPQTYLWHERAGAVVIDAGFGRHFDIDGLLAAYASRVGPNLSGFVQYDPRRVPSSQANRAVLAREILTPEFLSRMRSVLRSYVPDMVDQLRVVVTDGSAGSEATRRGPSPRKTARASRRWFLRCGVGCCSAPGSARRACCMRHSRPRWRRSRHERGSSTTADAWCTAVEAPERCEKTMNSR